MQRRKQAGQRRLSERERRRKEARKGQSVLAGQEAGKDGRCIMVGRCQEERYVRVGVEVCGWES
jgi:hypothetical protein